MNNSYDCGDCIRPDCAHRGAFRRLPKSEGGLGLCPGHMEEKLIFNEKKFMETDFGRELKNCIISVDDAVSLRAGKPDNLDEYISAARDVDMLLAQWKVYQSAMQQFYGLELYFTRTDDYFGVCTEDESFWLFKIERVIK